MKHVRFLQVRILLECFLVLYFYHLQTKFAKVMFSQVSVCPLVDVSASVPGGGCVCGRHPPGQTPLLGKYPRGRHPFLGRHPLPGQTPPPSADIPLWSDTPLARHHLHLWVDTPPVRHPLPGRRSTSRRYASH